MTVVDQPSSNKRVMGRLVATDGERKQNALTQAKNTQQKYGVFFEIFKISRVFPTSKSLKFLKVSPTYFKKDLIPFTYPNFAE